MANPKSLDKTRAMSKEVKIIKRRLVRADGNETTGADVRWVIEFLNREGITTKEGERDGDHRVLEVNENDVGNAKARLEPKGFTLTNLSKAYARSLPWQSD